MFFKEWKQKKEIKRKIAAIDEKLYGQLDREMKTCVSEIQKLVIETRNDHNALVKSMKQLARM